MSAKRSATQGFDKPVFSLPVRPLSDADLDQVQRAIYDLSLDWSAELHGICSEQATLVILPQDADDENGPSFLISRESDGFRLDQVRWDNLVEVGIFASLTGAVAELCAKLAFCSMSAFPASATIH